MVRDNHINELGKRGWTSPGVEINFPLSPDRLLIIYERTYFQDYANADTHLFPLTERKEVDEFNRYQVINSHRQVYSVSNQFSLAEQVCDELPQISKPRKKVQIDVSENNGDG